MGDATWVLRAWSFEEPAPATPEVTLEWKDGRVSGSSGCNRYFATVTAGDHPGDLKVGPAAGTRKACPAQETEVEGRWLRQLEHVVKYGFLVGQLALTYDLDGRIDVMLFARR
jgi:heat shock protein HslJ